MPTAVAQNTKPTTNPAATRPGNLEQTVENELQHEQKEKDQPTRPNLTTPRKAIVMFMSTMDQYVGVINSAMIGGDEQLKKLQPAFDCMDLEGTAAETSRSQAKDIAEELYDTINHIEKFDPASLNSDFGESNYSNNGKNTIVFFPRNQQQEDYFRSQLGNIQNIGQISLSKNPNTGDWLFDKETIAGIARMHDLYKNLKRQGGNSVDSLGDILEPLIPESLEKDFLYVKYWQWIAIFVLIFLGLLIDLAFRIFVRGVSHRILKHRRISENQRDAIKYTARPIGLLAAAVFWLTVLRLLDIEELYITGILDSALRIYIAVIATFAAWRLVDFSSLYFESRAKHTNTKFDDVLIPLLRKTCKIFIVAIGIVYSANALNVPIAPLLASLGIASVGISFAMKDTVENFFGSVAVLLDRPFDVGDWVVIDSAEGIIEQVGFRSTRIRTFYNSQITIPNANLVRAKVDNYGRRRYRRWKTNLCLQYDTTPDKLVAFTEGVRELIRVHPYTRKDYYEVYCNEFGESSFNILLYVFFEVPDWNTELRERERLFVDIVRLADTIGAEFAFPTRTIHLFNDEAGEHTQQHEHPQTLTERRAMVQGVHAAQKLTNNQPWRKHKPGPVVITGAPTDIKLDDAGNPIVEEDKDDDI